MAYFPMFVQLKKKKCLVIGGGKIALRKIEVLKDFEADITVIAPEMITQIRQIDQICRIFRTFMEKDFNEADFVIAATDDQKTKQHDMLCFSTSVFTFYTVLLLYFIQQTLQNFTNPSFRCFNSAHLNTG